MPAVSIITPTYNRPHLLSEALSWHQRCLETGSMRATEDELAAVA